ncbi:hypothetical protein AQZ49_07625 [Novosphingobium sp. FSW06-99]|nr:hypothetical protein AQZ49_07625 [Novosphingobium sp. FSW06-99]
MGDLIWRWYLAFKGYRTFGRKVAVFGNFTVVNRKNVTIGQNCAINHGTFLLGRTGITIGDDVVLSARCMVVDGGLDPASFRTPSARVYADRPIRIGNGSWIGAGAVILGGVTIGMGCVIGAGAVVNRDVPDGWLAAGNPARLIRRTVPESA